MTTAQWIELAGADNVRDLGGLPTVDGGAVVPGRLIRSANLQELTDDDVRHLVDDLGVRSVADLRTGVEVAHEGPGPITRERVVDVQHLSLFPEAGQHTDAAAVSEDSPVVLPWQMRDAPESGKNAPSGAAAVYLRYLDDRADSILAAMRLIAHTDGATIVHCAAGKDRTGVVIAFALAEVGVTREAIVEDYARSAEQIEAIFARLGARRTYAGDLADSAVDQHKPRAVTMERMLTAVDEIHGGVPGWLRANGWTAEDATALRHHLLDV